MCACFVYMHTCMNKETMKHRHLHEYFPWDDQPTSFTPAIAIAIPIALVCGSAPHAAGHGHTNTTASHSHHPDSWSWRYGYQESRGCEWRWRFFATGLLGNWPQYIFLDNEVDITLSCDCYQVPPSFDRAGTHTHSTDRKDRPWILPGPLSIIRSMAGWQLIRQGCWQIGTAGLGWRQRLREKLEMLEIALEFNWRVGRATRLNLPRTLDLDKLTLRTCSALHLF